VEETQRYEGRNSETCVGKLINMRGEIQRFDEGGKLRDGNSET
jgi:hypothetical protein